MLDSWLFNMTFYNIYLLHFGHCFFQMAHLSDPKTTDLCQMVQQMVLLVLQGHHQENSDPEEYFS